MVILVFLKLFQGVYKENENLIGKGVCHIELGSEEKDAPVEKLEDSETTSEVVNDVMVESDEEDEGGASEEQQPVEEEEAAPVEEEKPKKRGL